MPSPLLDSLELWARRLGAVAGLATLAAALAAIFRSLRRPAGREEPGARVALRRPVPGRRHRRVLRPGRAAVAPVAGPAVALPACRAAAGREPASYRRPGAVSVGPALARRDVRPIQRLRSAPERRAPPGDARALCLRPAPDVHRCYQRGHRRGAHLPHLGGPVVRRDHVRVGRAGAPGGKSAGRGVRRRVDRRMRRACRRWCRGCSESLKGGPTHETP